MTMSMRPRTNLNQSFASRLGLFLAPAVVLALCSQHALAVDFGVDMPFAGAGEPAQDQGDDTTQDITVDDNADRSAPEATGELPAQLLDLPPMPREFQPRIYETDRFPVPQCLDANVRFWKQIYREVDTNEALLHDRDDLTRIFERVSLPQEGRARRLEVARMQDELGRRLQILAGKLARIERGEDPSNLLTARDRDLLASFRPADRNAREVFAASGRVRLQSGLKRRFNEGVRRSLDLLPSITPLIEAAGVPRDIVHLPHVESSYVRNARSKVGAVGLWQIMPETMRLLMGRSAVHRRTDPVFSTRAAAKLLAQNYRSLRSWPLALTAYNHGLAGVSRAVRATGSRDLCTIIDRYESRSFRFASSNFYAQFLAARHVALDQYRELAVLPPHRSVLRPLLAHALREKSPAE